MGIARPARQRSPAAGRALLAALREALPARALSAAEQALEGGSDLSLTVIPLMADALDRAAPTGLTVVFDDYHLIGDEAARSVVRDLLDIAPPGVHVVITSRTRPAVNLARRLAAGEATVIDARQLAFLPDEAATLLNGVHHLSLTGADVREAVRRVHGWAAGLQLLAAALKLRGEGDQSSLIETLGAMTRGELVDYVTEELLADTSPAQCGFLLHTAVLPRINGALAAAVTEDPDARELLEELREQRQFVSAEPVPGGWLRVHELIRQALLASLERREPGTTTRLHARAAAWFEQHGMIAEAIEQTTAADDLQALVRLTRTHGFSLVMARQTSVLHAALDALRRRTPCRIRSWRRSTCSCSGNRASTHGCWPRPPGSCTTAAPTAPTPTRSSRCWSAPRSSARSSDRSRPALRRTSGMPARHSSPTASRSRLASRCYGKAASPRRARWPSP